MPPRTILFVSGFSSSLRARDLAWEFERYGRLVRCDIPALRSQTSAPYAFIEFRDDRDAEDAYYEMHGRSIDGRRIAVQWAKNPPSRAWRFDGGAGGPPPRRDERDSRTSPEPRDRRRSPSPRAGRRSASPRRASGSPPLANGNGADASPRRGEPLSPSRGRSSQSPEETEQVNKEPVKAADED